MHFKMHWISVIIFGTFRFDPPNSSYSNLKVLKYCQSLNYVAPLKSELAPLKGEANFLIGITRVRGVKSKSSEYNR